MRKSKVKRLVLYLVLLVLVLCSVVSTAYAKYASQTNMPSFTVKITAGTIGMDIIGGASGKIITPGTYIALEESQKPVVQIDKNSEECYIFVKVAKTANINSLIDVYANKVAFNTQYADKGYNEGVWYTLTTGVADDGGSFDVYYRCVTKEELSIKAGETQNAEYPVLRIAEKSSPPLWVKPNKATKDALAAIQNTDKVTFTAYAVQVTPGIDDPVTAWNKLGIHELGNNPTGFEQQP